ncbi:hypothetical protein [Candidatus Cytomitobacter indipagum]|uniref:hypothetical protein n=1 Tax=Candidatus Cytomitobacter indipagum TaxID=2601575 RepID=UPI00155AC1BE|nr:hypothetical protein [Candidatus Cytomitobacter indipagum]
MNENKKIITLLTLSHPEFNGIYNLSDALKELPETSSWNGSKDLTTSMKMFADFID